jgi:hypothetical protein
LTYKDLIRIIESKSLPVLIIFSLVFLPTIINKWINFFPQNWLLTAIITILWFGALYLHWRERKAWKRKTRLVSYLKRHGPWRSIRHLTMEWAAKDDYSEKIIKRSFGFRKFTRLIFLCHSPKKLTEFI